MYTHGLSLKNVTIIYRYISKTEVNCNGWSVKSKQLENIGYTINFDSK